MKYIYIYIWFIQIMLLSIKNHLEQSILYQFYSFKFLLIQFYLNYVVLACFLV